MSRWNSSGGVRHGQQAQGRSATGGLPQHGDLPRIAAEGRDVLLHEAPSDTRPKDATLAITSHRWPNRAANVPHET